MRDRSCPDCHPSTTLKRALVTNGKSAKVHLCENWEIAGECTFAVRRAVRSSTVAVETAGPKKSSLWLTEADMCTEVWLAGSKRNGSETSRCMYAHGRQAHGRMWRSMDTDGREYEEGVEVHGELAAAPNRKNDKSGESGETAKNGKVKKTGGAGNWRRTGVEYVEEEEYDADGKEKRNSSSSFLRPAYLDDPFNVRFAIRTLNER